MARVAHYWGRFAGCVKLWLRMRQIRYAAQRRGTVVFNTVGCYLFDLNIELYLASLLARAGFQVHVLLDDHQLEHWEYLQRQHRDDDYRRHHSAGLAVRLRLYAWLSRTVFAHPNLRTVWYSEALRRTPSEIPLTPSDEAHAASSVLRYFQEGEFRRDDPGHQAYYEASLTNCRKSKRVGTFVVNELQPDLFINSHGVYSTWGPCYDIVRASGCRCLVYSTAVYQQRALSIVDTLLQTMSDATDWRQREGVALTADQQQRVDDLFDDRFHWRTVDTQTLYKGATRGTVVGIRGTGEATFGLFANVVWDGDIAERNTVFAGAVEYVVETINHFRTSPHRLVIRFHPSEVTYLSKSRRLEEVIRRHVPDLDAISNVTVISSSAKIDVYALVRSSIDVGLIYDGMLALELTYLGIPVIGPGRARCSHTGVMFEPRTKDEFFAMLDAPEQLRERIRTGTNRDCASRFTHWYLFECCYRVPILRENRMLEIDYDADADALDPARSPELLRTINRIAREVDGLRDVDGARGVLSPPAVRAVAR